MRIDPAAISGAFTSPAKQLQAEQAAAPQRLILAKKKALQDAAELGKAALDAAKPIDLGRTIGAAKAQLRQAAALAAQAPAHSLDNPRPAADAPAAPGAPTTESRMAAFLESYGAARGEGRYNEKFDLDGDGVIGFTDLNTLLSQPPDKSEQARVFSSGDLDSLLASFNKQLGDDGFNAEFDLNQDGVVNFTDLNTLVQNLAPDAAEQSPVASEVTGLLGAFNRRAGQDGFDAKFDYDNDGVVSFADLNQLLDQLAGQ